MKRIHICWSCIRTAFAKIHLVDKCLILLMAVLLIQSAYNLLANPTASVESTNIDMIVRTSTAAIFGYFLSANFICHASSGGACCTKKPSCTCSASTDASEKEESSKKEKHAETLAASRLQIFAATGIALFCLLVLIALRNVPGLGSLADTPATAATVAQFRDFISGCVGFLIGCPTAKANS